MKKRIEDALREQLHRAGAEFDMDRSMPARVVRRSRQRRFRVASAIVAVAVVGATTSAVALRVSHEGSGPASTHSLRLADYLLGSDSSYSTGVARPDDSVLQQVASCLRDQGFPVPDPTHTGPGTQIRLPDSIDPSSEAWKEAAFVTCRASRFDQVAWAQPGVLGLPLDQAGLQDFVSCMHDQGYDLPAPTKEGDRYEFDLAQSGIDTSTDQWNRALFVTCAPPPYPGGGSGSGSGSGGSFSGSESGIGGSSSGSGSGSG